MKDDQIIIVSMEGKHDIGFKIKMVLLVKYTNQFKKPFFKTYE